MAEQPPTQPKSLEEIVREVGTYAIDAFQFVRDGVTAASERVHGPQSKCERRVAKWMAEENLTLDAVAQMIEAEQVPPDILRDVRRMGGIESLNRHISGRQLCEAMKDLAIERWGLLAGTVLAHWGIHSTKDFGRIVFALVENQILSKQPQDSIDDFDRVYSFHEVFDKPYRITLTDAG